MVEHWLAGLDTAIVTSSPPLSLTAWYAWGVVLLMSTTSLAYQGGGMSTSIRIVLYSYPPGCVAWLGALPRNVNSRDLGSEIFCFTWCRGLGGESGLPVTQSPLSISWLTSHNYQLSKPSLACYSGAFWLHHRLDDASPWPGRLSPHRSEGRGNAGWPYQPQRWTTLVGWLCG